jgi:hypothetical protein
MTMHRPTLVLGLLVAAATPAAADTFGGFSGVDVPYLVNQDRVCKPLDVKDGAATGTPACAKVEADEIARLTIKPPQVQRGAKATFAATVSGKTLTVTKGSDTVVTWNAFDPISKVVDVYASQYEDRVAVAYTTRRLGKDVTDVVAFVLVKTTGKTTITPPGVAPVTPPQPPTTAPPEDPKLTKAVDAARKAAKGKALAAWQSVLALDADHSEAQFQIAKLQVTAKQTADAIATLEKLAKSSRADAIDWLVEARFDAAFATVRADAKFRGAVGLDRKPATPYERLMGFGGQWEQTGTMCDQAEVHFTALRDRTFKIRVKSSCSGSKYDIPFKGTWRLDDAGQLILMMKPAPGEAPSKKDEALCRFEKATGDEESLRCNLGHDIEFVALPTRR